VMHDSEQEPFSVLDELQSFDWSSQESVAYEAAIEAINAAVGAYTARIAAEETKPQPDGGVIAAWHDGLINCTAQRRQLDPADHGQIAEVRRRFSELAREIRRGGPQ
jgi:hypothetical protein